MMSFPRFTFLCALLLAGAPPCRAQQIILKNGQAVAAQNLKRDGNVLLSNVEVAGQVGQVGYPIANIDHLDLPRPPQMIKAEQALATGKFTQALAEIEPVVAAQFPLRDIKGNYWTQAALLKSSAQLGAGKTADASAVLTQLSLFDMDPDAALAAKARLAGILALGGKDKAAEAIQRTDEVIRATEDRRALAEAYLARGRALLAQGKQQDALLAFLHLPVFYDQQPGSTAAAILGSARCYLALGDTERAVRAFLEVEDQFPALPEAAAAKAEIEKGGARLSGIVTKLRNEKAEADKQFNGEDAKDAANTGA